ncbi:MAG: L-galactonate transporter [Nocardia sp.]|uniref:MFS transporter n=1 Tax=Nocardia sp. TaxID=1821 RepID=UPI00262407BB|nr:MFS transporter [Nocardia sp.]MCU1643365.1 L-galactonate transporter [Nocardia sp.]
MATDTADFAAPGARRIRGKNLALLTASNAMDNAEASVTTVLFPLMRDALGLSSAALGTIVAVGKVVGAGAGIPWAFLARRYPRKIALAVCSGFWGLWAIAAGFSDSFLQFVILYAIAAAGFAGSGPIALGIVGDIYDDNHRGRATGLFYAGVALTTGIAAPLFGRLSEFENGWRYGYFIAGGMCVLVGVLIVSFLEDPIRAGDTAASAVRTVEEKARTVRSGLRELFAVQTFRYILMQRLLSGQNVIMSFGVVFLVEERGFTTATASIVALPFALGYIAGTLTGGRVIDRVHRARPRSGRIAMLQISQIAFAAVAFIGTQLAWSSIGAYVAIFAAIGFLQGQVPVINRPLIMAVSPPDLRPLAFAVSVSMADALAYGAYALLTGVLGDAIGLQGALLIVTVLLTAINGVASALLYRPYARDSAAIAARLPIHTHAVLAKGIP